MNNLVKDFAKFLEGRGLVIENEAELSQIPKEDYPLAKQIFKCREVLVPLLLKLAIGIKDEKDVISYSISYKGGMYIVRQFLQNIVDQFLDNLMKKKLILPWKRKDECHYEIPLPKDKTKRRFFRSAWAEQVFRYAIMKTVQEFCRPRKIMYKAFQNACLRRTDENDLLTELDLVVQIAKRFYVFEIKSGPNINIIQWAKREMNLVKDCEIVRNIVCTIHDNIPEKIFEPQLLLKLSNIELELYKILEADFPAI